MRQCLSLFLIALLSQQAIAQSKKNFDPQQTITANSARHSIIELLNELAQKHPGFYRYTGKMEFTRFIDSSLKAINGPQDQLSYYRKLKPLRNSRRPTFTTESWWC